jgi:hypothetical protein
MMQLHQASYLGEDSGSQAIAGQSSRIVKQFWRNLKTVSQIVSHRTFSAPQSLLQTQLDLEAKIGIGWLMPD